MLRFSGVRKSETTFPFRRKGSGQFYSQMQSVSLMSPSVNFLTSCLKRTSYAKPMVLMFCIHCMKYVHFNPRKYFTQAAFTAVKPTTHKAPHSSRTGSHLSEFSDKEIFQTFGLCWITPSCMISFLPESRARPKQDSGIGTKRTQRPKLPC